MYFLIVSRGLGRKWFKIGLNLKELAKIGVGLMGLSKGKKDRYSLLIEFMFSKKDIAICLIVFNYIIFELYRNIKSLYNIHKLDMEVKNDKSIH